MWIRTPSSENSFLFFFIGPHICGSMDGSYLGTWYGQPSAPVLCLAARASAKNSRKSYWWRLTLVGGPGGGGFGNISSNKRKLQRMQILHPPRTAACVTCRSFQSSSCKGLKQNARVETYQKGQACGTQELVQENP